MSGTTAAERDIVRKLARGSFLSRLKSGGRQPLKLIAVPRDHVQGNRQRGDGLLAGRFTLGSESVPLASIDFSGLGTQGPLAAHLQGFSWLRDLRALGYFRSGRQHQGGGRVTTSHDHWSQTPSGIGLDSTISTNTLSGARTKKLFSLSDS